MCKLSDTVIVEIDYTSMEVPKLKALCVFICEACAGYEVPVQLAVMIEKKIKMPMLQQFSSEALLEEKYIVNQIIGGLELIIGRTDWEEVNNSTQSDKDEEEEKEVVVQEDSNSYSTKIHTLLKMFPHAWDLRFTRQVKHTGLIFPEFTDIVADKVIKFYFDASILGPHDVNSIQNMFPKL